MLDLQVSPARLQRAADEWAQELNDLLGLLPSLSGHEDDKLTFGNSTATTFVDAITDPELSGFGR